MRFSAAIAVPFAILVCATPVAAQFNLNGFLNDAKKKMEEIQKGAESALPLPPEMQTNQSAQATSAGTEIVRGENFYRQYDNWVNTGAKHEIVLVKFTNKEIMFRFGYRAEKGDADYERRHSEMTNFLKTQKRGKTSNAGIRVRIGSETVFVGTYFRTGPGDRFTMIYRGPDTELWRQRAIAAKSIDLRMENLGPLVYRKGWITRENFNDPSLYAGQDIASSPGSLDSMATPVSFSGSTAGTGTGSASSLKAKCLGHGQYLQNFAHNKNTKFGPSEINSMCECAIGQSDIVNAGRIKIENIENIGDDLRVYRQNRDEINYRRRLQLCGRLFV